MGTNKSKPRVPIAERRRARMEQERARQLLEVLLLEAKIERLMQAEILENLKQKHKGDIPVPAIWDFIADRRITIHGAGPLAARG